MDQALAKEEELEKLNKKIFAFNKKEKRVPITDAIHDLYTEADAASSK